MWDGNRKGIMIIIIKQLLVFWDLFPLASLQFNKWIWHHYWAGDKLALFPLVYLLRPLKVKVARRVQFCDPMDYTVHGILQSRILEWVAFPFSRGSSQPRDLTQVSTLQVDSLLAEPQGKPKNTGVGSLSLLLRIFLAQELNLGLLHCWRILYQLSYEGSPLRPLGSSLWPERSFHALLTVTNLFNSKSAFIFSSFASILPFSLSDRTALAFQILPTLSDPSFLLTLATLT